MTNGEIFRAYSIEYGTLIGFSWGALLLSYAYGIRDLNAFLILISFVLCSVCLILPFILGFRLNRKAWKAGISVSYLQGLLISLSMFLYASMMGALITYGYFEFLDHGAFMEALNKMLEEANMAEVYSQMGMGSQYNELIGLLGETEATSSFDKALLMFNNNITWGIFISFLVAISISWKSKKSN